MHPPLIFEALTIAFYLILAVAAPLTPTPRERRVPLILPFLGAAALVAAAAYAVPVDVRLWLGHAYLVTGYWLPALLIDPATLRQGCGGPPDVPDPRSPIPEPRSFEAWLLRTDERWFPLRPALPVWATTVLEASYLLCYLLVPAAFVFVWRTTTPEGVDGFWSAVLLAGFACYGLLPWLVCRPPRLRHGGGATSMPALRRLNVYILTRASHGFNTFPSGHVAVSVAAALAVLSISAVAGTIALVVALAIGAGAIAGRYHYVTDVVIGGFVGASAWLLI